MRSFILSLALLAGVAGGTLLTPGRAAANPFYWYVPPPPMVMSNPAPMAYYSYSAPYRYYVPNRPVYVFDSYTTPPRSSRGVERTSARVSDYFIIGPAPAAYYPRSRYGR